MSDLAREPGPVNSNDCGRGPKAQGRLTVKPVRLSTTFSVIKNEPVAVALVPASPDRSAIKVGLTLLWDAWRSAIDHAAATGDIALRSELEAGALPLALIGENTDRGEPLPADHMLYGHGLDSMQRAAKFAFEGAKARFHNAYVRALVTKPGLPGNRAPTVPDVLRYLAVVLDFDALHDTAAARWREWVDEATGGLAPSMVVETSPGSYQVWFVFTRGVTAGEYVELAAAAVLASGCDPSAKAENHNFRVPGGLNYPTRKKIARGRSPEPVLARIVDKIGNAVDPDALRAALEKGGWIEAVRAAHAAAATAARAVVDVPGDDDEPVPLQGLPAPVVAVLQAPSGDRSHDVYAITRGMKAAGFGPLKIAATIETEAPDAAEKFENRAGGLIGQVQAILQKPDPTVAAFKADDPVDVRQDALEDAAKWTKRDLPRVKERLRRFLERDPELFFEIVEVVERAGKIALADLDRVLGV